MYPPAFEYQAPDTLEGALAALAELGDEGRVLAGGQSLIPMMKFHLAAPGHLGRYQPDHRTLLYKEIQRVALHRRPGPAQRCRPVRRRQSLGRGLLRRSLDLRPPGAQPRHGVRIGGPLRPRRRLELGNAGRPRRRDGPKLLGESACGDRRLYRELFHQLAGTGRDGHRSLRADSLGRHGRRLHEAGAQDRRLRHRGSGHPVGTGRRRKHRPGRNRADRGELPEHPGIGSRGPLARPDAVGRVVRRGRSGGPLPASDPETDVRGSADWKRNVVAVYTRRGLAQALASAGS